MYFNTKIEFPIVAKTTIFPIPAKEGMHVFRDDLKKEFVCIDEINNIWIEVSSGGTVVEIIVGDGLTGTAVITQSGIIEVNFAGTGTSTLVARADHFHNYFSSNGSLVVTPSTTMTDFKVNFAGTGSLDTSARSDHNHTGIYAPAGQGVINGNLHNHYGGDGAQLNHLHLQNIGDYAHISIDDHINNPILHTGAGTFAPMNLIAGDGLLGGGFEVTTTISVDFAGTGVATTVSRSDHTHDDRYYLKTETYTQSQIDDFISSKANTIHNHDDLYYSQTYIDYLSGTSVTIFNLANSIDSSTVGESGIAVGNDTNKPRIIYDGVNWSFTDDGIVFNSFAAGTGDITAVIAADGLLGGANVGSATLSVNFAGTGSATTVARSDHLHDDRYYVKSETYTQGDIDTFISSKANTIHDHDDLYYQKTETYTQGEIDNFVNSKANTIHDHDDLYYQKTETYTQGEVDDLLANKSDITHTHTSFSNDITFNNFTLSDIGTLSVNTAVISQNIFLGQSGGFRYEDSKLQFSNDLITWSDIGSGSGANILNYQVFNQLTATTYETINHNLGRKPIVHLVSSGGNQFFSDVIHHDVNSFSVSVFPASTFDAVMIFGLDSEESYQFVSQTTPVTSLTINHQMDNLPLVQILQNNKVALADVVHKNNGADVEVTLTPATTFDIILIDGSANKAARQSYEQNVATTITTIYHNMSNYPVVQLLQNDTQIFGQIKHNSFNDLTITTTVPITYTAILFHGDKVNSHFHDDLYYRQDHIDYLSGTSVTIFNLANSIDSSTVGESGIAVGNDTNKPRIIYDGVNWSFTDDGIVFNSFAAGTGDITAVVASDGLLGGATVGTATLSVDFAGNGSAISVSRSDHTHYVFSNGISIHGDLDMGGYKITNVSTIEFSGSAILGLDNINNDSIKFDTGVINIGQNDDLVKIGQLDIDANGTIENNQSNPISINSSINLNNNIISQIGTMELSQTNSITSGGLRYNNGNIQFSNNFIGSEWKLLNCSKFIYTQSIASSFWLFNHSLFSESVAVQVFQTLGGIKKQVIPEDIEIIGTNTISIAFGGVEVSGEAIIIG